MNRIFKQFIGGMKWTSMSTIIVTIVQLVQFALLARLISKDDFGLMSMITVVIVFSQVFTDMGMSSAIIQRQDVNKDHLSSLYWLNIIAGFFVFLLVLLVSPLVADFYKEPRLNTLLGYISIIFFVTPFGQQFQYLLQKELRFDVLAKVEILSVLLGSVIAIGIALLHFGVWSLIWSQICTASVKSISLVLIGWKNWKPKLRFRFADLNGYWQFGLFQMGSRTVNYFASNIDYLLIGRYLGSEALGIYSLAYQLIVIPVTKINPIITKVAFPIFSLNQKDDEILKKGFINMSKLLAVISFPILIGLMSTADIFVPVIFGTKWNNAISVIQILSVLGILRVLMNPNGSLLLAKGRADIGFLWDFFVAIFNGSLIWMSVQRGINAVAIMYVCVSLLNFICGRQLLKFIIGLKAKEYFNSLSMPFFISIIMGSSVFGISRLISNFYSPSWILMIFLIIIGILLYAIFTFIFNKSIIMQYKNVFSKRNNI